MWAGTVTTKGIAKWTGSDWVSLGGISGNYGEVLGLTVSGGSVFAAGTFSAAGGVPATNIAQWNGSAWSALGSGIGDDIYYGLAAAATPNEMYTGGNFFEAGGKSSRFFARYAFAPALTALESWRQTHFGSTANTGNGANSADPDTDGIPNLVEFALGLNPNQNSAGQLPLGQLAVSDFVIGFSQPSGVSGITWGAEWSPTLLPGSWTGTGQTHTFRTPVSANKKLFVRLRVTVQ